MSQQEQLVKGDYEYQFEANPQVVKPRGQKYRGGGNASK